MPKKERHGTADFAATRGFTKERERRRRVSPLDHLRDVSRVGRRRDTRCEVRNEIVSALRACASSEAVALTKSLRGEEAKRERKVVAPSR